MVDTLKVTKTSYGIDGTNNGAFKFLDLDEGYYRVFICKNNYDKPLKDTDIWDPAHIGSYTYSIYNLSNYDYCSDNIDVGNYRWQPFSIEGVSSRPIAVNKNATVYWCNIEDDTLK